MTSNRSVAPGLLAQMDQRVKATRPLLEAAAENIRVLQGHEHESLRWYAEVRFLVLQLDFDLVATLLAMLRDTSTCLTLEKNLIVLLAEAESAVGPVLNGLSASLRKSESTTASQFDVPTVNAAVATFTSRLAEMRADKTFMSNLTTLRNTAAAHLWGKKGGRLNGAAQLVLARRGWPSSQFNVAQNQFFAYSTVMLEALDELSGALIRARAAA